MSQYQLTPFKPSPVLATAGFPVYLLGSYNDKTGPTQGYVISDSATGTTGTLVFQITSGNVPVTGSLITVIGTANGSGNLNVTNVAVTVISTTLQGVCTVTYTISSTTFTSAQDFGQVIIPQPEVGEAVSGTTYTSIPVCRPYNNPNIQEGQSFTATINLPNTGNLSGIVVVLQGADYDLDSEYKTIHTFGAATAANTSDTFQSGTDTPAAAGNTVPGAANLMNYRFYRFKFTSITGSGPAIGKIVF